MNKRLVVAGALLMLMMLAVVLYAAAAAPASSRGKTLRYRIVRHTRSYDVVRGHHRILRVKHHQRYVTVRGVPRYRVVTRRHRSVLLRKAPQAIVAGSRNTAIVREVLASVGRPSSASSTQPDSSPGAGNDGLAATRWTAGSTGYPQWWMVDLGSVTTLRGVEVDWSQSARRAYRYRIEVSLDGTSFTTVKDRSRNQTKGPTTDAVTAAARYVRVQVLGVSGSILPAAADEITVYAAAASADPSASDPGATPIPMPTPPTPTPTPSTPSASSTLAPSGGDDTAAIQGAVNACGTGGGTVTFAPGTYSITSPIKLPPGNTAVLTLSGYGAKVVLNGASGFLEFNDTASYQSFRYFTVKGFELDASKRRNVHGFYFIGAYNAISESLVMNGDVEDITLKDLYIHGAPSMNSTNQNALAIGLGCKQNARPAPVTNYVRHIDIDNVRIEGGDSGILVMTELWSKVLPATMPADVNQVCDDINISNVHFDSLKTDVGSRQYHVGIQINGWGRGGTCNITDCYLRGSEDDLLEIDNMMVANVTDVDMVKSGFSDGTLLRGFGYTLDAVPPSEGTMRVTYTGCTYTQDGGGASGFGYAWDEIARIYHPTYQVVYNDCWVTRDGGVAAPYTGP